MREERGTALFMLALRHQYYVALHSKVRPKTCFTFSDEIEKWHQKWIFGCPKGAMTLKFKLSQDCCTVRLLTKFHHPIFNHMEVMYSQTYKQTKRFGQKHPLHSTKLVE